MSNYASAALEAAVAAALEAATVDELVEIFVDMEHPQTSVPNFLREGGARFVKFNLSKFYANPPELGPKGISAKLRFGSRGFLDTYSPWGAVVQLNAGQMVMHKPPDHGEESEVAEVEEEVVEEKPTVRRGHLTVVK